MPAEDPSHTPFPLDKIHWNIHTNCNLPCGFCYLKREKSADMLTTDESIELIRSISGATRRLVFTGGDPLMRNDIVDLVTYAKSLGCQIELHTNAKLLDCLDSTRLFSMLDELGLSLDGESAEVHDRMRASPGNFEANLKALELASAHGVPTTVRTMVAKRNHMALEGIAPLLRNYSVVHTWCIRQFVPLSRGAKTNRAYAIEFDLFRRCANRLRSYALSINPQYRPLIVRGEDMSCYCFVSSEGTFFTRSVDGLQYIDIGKYPEMSAADLLYGLIKRIPRRISARALTSPV